MSWICPHCQHAAVLRGDDINAPSFDMESKEGFRRYKMEGIKCPNPECNKVVVSLSIRELRELAQFQVEGALVTTIPVLPLKQAGRVKSYPDYIPAQILQDYREACAIVDLSPKSSATLARRALQGMIRDFWNVKEENLSKAIKTIEDKVSSDIWGAIDGVRKVGNIGAHMEKDINLIIDVNPEEATLLISMIEMLLEDWYVARFEKHQRIEKMKLLAVEKTQAKKQ